MLLLLKTIGRRIRANGFFKYGVLLLMVAVLIPASIYGYFESIDWCPVHRPVSLHPGRIEQTFKVNYTARYFADIEFKTCTLSPDTVQCLTGVTEFPSAEPKCNGSEKPILNFSWRLLRGGKKVSAGRYGEDKGGSVSPSTVEADFADFDAKRGDRYTLVVDVDSDATKLDVASPTLYVTVNPVNLESAMVLEGLSRVAAAALGLVGLACVLLAIRWQQWMFSALLIVVAVSSVAFLDGCSREPTDPHAALVGHSQIPPPLEAKDCASTAPQDGRTTRNVKVWSQGAALTVDDVAQGRDLRNYDRLELADRVARLAADRRGEAIIAQARTFLWQHWREGKRAYLILTLSSVDFTSTSHVFIEKDEEGRWRVFWRIVRQNGDVYDAPAGYSMSWVIPGESDKPGAQLPPGRQPDPKDKLEFRDVCGDVDRSF